MPLHANIIYVNQSATGLNNGTSWADAFTNPNLALPTAQYGDEIWVAKGSYFPIPPSPLLSFVLVSGTKLLGGFDGTENSASQRDWSANETILSGELSGFTWLNVVYGENTDSTTLLDGFTIRGGHADITIFGYNCYTVPNGADCYGGGIYLYNISPDTPTRLTVRNCRFINNHGRLGGGIAANFENGSGGLIVEKCYFAENGTNGTGGAVLLYTSQHQQHKMRVDSCVFEHNYGNSNSCIEVSNPNHGLDLRISNSVFRLNEAQYDCAGVRIASGYARPVVENCYFYRNAAGSNQFEPGIGGALIGINCNIRNCVFEENIAYIGGAISGSNTEISNCLFVKNRGVREGGALRLYKYNYLANNTFINNKADRFGGAIFNVADAQDTILNCIFVGNEAGESGDWMYSVFGHNYVDFTMIDVADCEALKEGLHPMYDTLTCGPNMFFNIDPQFRDTAAGDYRLRGCSPLLNQGDSTWAARFGLLKDLAGNYRWQDGLPDIGAYETPISDSLQLIATVTPSSSTQNPNGNIILNSVSGGTMPYSYEWNTGSIESEIGSLTPGVYTATITDGQYCTASWTFEVLFVSDTEQAEDLGNLLIYPNPATNWTRLLLPEADDDLLLEVVDALGKTVISQLVLKREKVFDLNLKGLANGAYLLIIKQNDGATHIKRLIKKS